MAAFGKIQRVQPRDSYSCVSVHMRQVQRG